MRLLFAILLLPFGVLHFLPTIIAVLRNGRSVLGIFLVNLLLSWTLIGWVAALIWSLTTPPKWVYQYAGPRYRRNY